MLNLKNKRLTSLIEKLINMWSDWMKYHYIANDHTLSYKERRAAGEKCEDLQIVRYKLLADIDDVFNECIQRR